MVISASLRALISGEWVAASKINSKLLSELMEDGLLSVKTHGSKKSYRARDTEVLKRFLIDKDEKYRILEVSTSDSRASMATETGNSKLLMVRSCPGFPVNSYEPIDCLLNGKPFVVNPQEDSFLYIADWQNFTIPKDVIVIGIENMENFRMIRHQKQFFDDYLRTHGLTSRVLFVSRYPQSTDLRNWLTSISNYYLHFGDFDLAGIHIYQSEFEQYLDPFRTSFLIPDDIASRLESGSSKRFDEQYDRFENISSENQELQELISLIRQHRKGYDQEGYIEQLHHCIIDHQ